MRAPASAAAIAALALSVTGCGAPDFGSEPSSYSSNWPHSEPETTESSSTPPSVAPSATPKPSASARPKDGLPAKLGGQPRIYDVVEDDSAALKVPGVKNDFALYGADNRTTALVVYRGAKDGIDRVVREHRKRPGTRVGRATCVKIGSLANLCWRSGPDRVVSVTASSKRPVQQLTPILDEAWRTLQ